MKLPRGDLCHRRRCFGQDSQVHPDLILLDPFALPDTCGLALLHELRTRLTLPILVLSQHPPPTIKSPR
ncbi:MAG: hypothetical protein R2867_34350 [Caldilineaceae bacterium]